MYIYRDVASLRKYLDEILEDDKAIGFVPTMGALHKGHISLLEKAKADCDCSVVSIFVNPRQFNNPDDLLKYPRTVEEDINQLYANNCDVVFIPSVEEVYPDAEPDMTIEFDGLDKRMEGKFRPGHFDGVAKVMFRLLKIVRPHRLYMGQKDFQQTAIVRHVIRHFNIPVEFVTCQTVREPNGLAMSSRNQLLDPALRQKASLIIQVLKQAKKDIDVKSVAQIRSSSIEKFAIPNFKAEYFEIADGNTLIPVTDARQHDFIVACCAIWVGEVRLIDNIIIRSN